ncbi:MAG TPA: hypothetical protein VFS76_06505 [Pyrinomonadaceae bacterium]|nr:hypothetical protein [Pyrinomonadaceae bacterium]
MRLTLLDSAFSLLDDRRSPQDFTIILYFRESPDVDRLREGAKSARERFKTSGSRLERDQWVYQDSICDIPVQSIEQFVNERFDLSNDCPVKQIVVANTLATRFHHAAADGMSAAMWLGHQLSVAYGITPPETSAELSLRCAETSVRRSKFAYDGACDPLWTRNSKRSGTRHWITRGFVSEDLQRACRRAGGFTYSDLLATCVLEVYRQWNHQHAKNGQPRVGVWLPMNIRRRSGEGFGNGTSRIRLYARYSPSASLINKAREVRRQVAWSTDHGEWAVPELPLLTRLPGWIARPALRGYLNRPSIDMATGIFSHADRWGGASEAFRHVERIECIGLLHPRQALAINGATHSGQTWLTFTYDAGMMSDSEAGELAGMYEQQIELAQAELL